MKLIPTPNMHFLYQEDNFQIQVTSTDAILTSTYYHPSSPSAAKELTTSLTNIIQLHHWIHLAVTEFSFSTKFTATLYVDSISSDTASLTPSDSLALIKVNHYLMNS
jgi:hypothetical protein